MFYFSLMIFFIVKIMCIIVSEWKNLKSIKLDRILKSLYSIYFLVVSYLIDYRYIDMNVE